jgi:hypothetical protein
LVERDPAQLRRFKEGSEKRADGLVERLIVRC